MTVLSALLPDPPEDLRNRVLSESSEDMIFSKLKSTGKAVGFTHSTISMRLCGLTLGMRDRIIYVSRSS